MTERQDPGGQESADDIVDLRGGVQGGADQRSAARRRRQEVAARLRAERAARGASVPGGMPSATAGGSGVGGPGPQGASASVGAGGHYGAGPVGQAPTAGGQPGVAPMSGGSYGVGQPGAAPVAPGGEPAAGGLVAEPGLVGGDASAQLQPTEPMVGTRGGWGAHAADVSGVASRRSASAGDELGGAAPGGGFVEPSSHGAHARAGDMPVPAGGDAPGPVTARQWWPVDGADAETAPLAADGSGYAAGSGPVGADGLGYAAGEAVASTSAGSSPYAGNEASGPVTASLSTDGSAYAGNAVSGSGTAPLRERLGLDDPASVEPGPVTASGDVGSAGEYPTGPPTPAEPFPAVEPAVGGAAVGGSARRADQRAGQQRGVAGQLRVIAGSVGESVRRDKVTPKLVVAALAALLVGVLIGSLLPRGGSEAGDGSVDGVANEAGVLNPANGLDSMMNCVPGQFVAFVAAVGPPKAYTTAVGTMYLQVGRAEETPFGSGVLHLTKGENLCEASTVGYTDMATRADWYFLWAGAFATQQEAESWCTAMGYQSLEEECIIQPAG